MPKRAMNVQERAGGARFWFLLLYRTVSVVQHRNDEKRAPSWVFNKGGKPSRVIATLEALATLLALKLFGGGEPGADLRKVKLQPTWTDNRGNGSALIKLMSTRFLVNALLMGLGTHCKHVGIKPFVEWAPRTIEPRSGRSGQRSHRCVFGMQTNQSGPQQAVLEDSPARCADGRRGRRGQPEGEARRTSTEPSF